MVLAGVPGLAWSQAPDSVKPLPKSIISISPVDLLYKVAVGYQRGLGRHSAVGVIGAYHYGLAARYKGWQVTGYYRQFFTHQFPTGLYIELQASAFDFLQEANLINRQTHKPYSFKYRQLSGGVGVGFGYQSFLFPRTFSNRLVGDAMLGVRGQIRPIPTYDDAIYYPDYGFLGNTDEANWHLGFSPGSIAHGLLTLGYLF